MASARSLRNEVRRAPEEVTYVNCGDSAYIVFAKDDGRHIGDLYRSGRDWYADSHRYATRREAAEMLLDKNCAQEGRSA